MSSPLLRGSLETIVIKLLADHGEMYGYEITQKVKALTKDQLKLTEGALYPALHKLEAKGILSTDTRFEDNRYRKYYRLTPQGQTLLEQLLEEMNQHLQHLQLLLFPPHNMLKE